MFNPKVSVIIATRDRADKLSKCLETVFRQTYTNYEILIIDNGSTDSTTQLISRLKKTHGSKIKRIEYLDSHTPSKIRNYGLAFMSKSVKYVKWLDDDDGFENKYALENLVSEIEKSKNNLMVYGVCRYVSDTGETIKYSSFTGYPIHTTLISGSFPCSTVLYSKEVFKTIKGMPENLESSEDIYLALQVVELAFKLNKEFSFTNKVITIRRRNKKGVFFRNCFNGVKDRAMTSLRKRFAYLALPLLPKIISFLLLEIATITRKKYLLLLNNLGYTTEHIFIKKEYYFDSKLTII